MAVNQLNKDRSVMPPKISFCTACKGRRTHLFQTLRHNLEITKDYPNVEFVILAYGDSLLTKRIKEKFPDEMASGRIRLASIEAEYWRYSTAKNTVARVAIEMGERNFFAEDNSSDNIAYLKNFSRSILNYDPHIIVNLDADNYLQKDLPAWLADTLGNNDKLIVRAVAEGATHPIRGCGGLVGCHKKLFYTFGGYNQEMDHWSGEDQDLTLRVVAGEEGYSFLRIPETYVGHALLHSDGARKIHQTPENQKRSDEVLAESDGFCDQLREAAKRGEKFVIEETLPYLEIPKPDLVPVANIDENGQLAFGCGNVTLYNASYGEDEKTVTFQEHSLSLEPILCPSPDLMRRSKRMQERLGENSLNDSDSPPEEDGVGSNYRGLVMERRNVGVRRGGQDR